MNLSFDRVTTKVGDNAFLNSDFFSFSSRNSLDYIQTAGTQAQFNMFNYDILATEGQIIGSSPIYLGYRYRLSSNLITNTVDLRRGFVASLALFGGFLVSCFYVLWIFVGACQRFESDKAVIDDLYTLNPEGQTVDKKDAVHSAIRFQRVNNLSAFEYVLCCCCESKKRDVYHTTEEKLRHEADLAEMVQTLRQVKFMRQLNEDKGRYNDLVKYGKEYRVNVPQGAHFPDKTSIRIDADAAKAQTLNQSDDTLARVLTADICGEVVRADQIAARRDGI